MATLNLCQFIGNIGADPEIRYFDGGGKVANARIAVTERFVDKNNTQQERTEWISLVFNGKLVDVVGQFVHKGSTIYVSGKWHTREWQDQSGNKRQSTELTVLSLQLLDKPQAQQSAPAPQSPGYAPAPGYQAPPQPQYQQPAPAPAPQYQAPAQPPQYAPPTPPASPQYAPPAPPQAPAQQYPPQPGQPGNTQYPPMNSPEYTAKNPDDLSW